MDINRKFRQLIQQRAGTLCLLGLLSATFMHTTSFMSKFFYDSLILGAVAAFAIDSGILSMSILKDELMKDGQLAWMVRSVTALVLFSSGIANMAEGFESAYGTPLTLAALIAKDIFIIVQWIAATIVFPVLAYIMTDAIGTRSAAKSKNEERAKKKPKTYNEELFVNENLNNNPLRRANKQVKVDKQKRIEALKLFITVNPSASLTEMANAVGVSSRETIRKYLKEINTAHQQ